MPPMKAKRGCSLWDRTQTFTHLRSTSDNKAALHFYQLAEKHGISSRALQPGISASCQRWWFAHELWVWGSALHPQHAGKAAGLGLPGPTLTPQSSAALPPLHGFCLQHFELTPEAITLSTLTVLWQLDRQNTTPGPAFWSQRSQLLPIKGMKSAGHVQNAEANFVIKQFTSNTLRTLNIFELCVTGDEAVFDLPLKWHSRKVHL